MFYAYLKGRDGDRQEGRVRKCSNPLPSWHGQGFVGLNIPSPNHFRIVFGDKF